MTNLNSHTSGFTFSGKEEKMDSEVVEQLVIDEVKLPSFYTFDEPTPVYTINIESGKSNSAGPVALITISDSEKNPVGETYDNIELAYDYVKDELQGDVVFTGNLKLATGKDNNSFISVPSRQHPKHFRLLMSHTDRDAEYIAKANYYEFLELTNNYEKNSTNFKTCFYWLDAHPAFWSRTETDVNRWRTSNNSHICVDVTLDEAGNTVVMLEYGGAVEPERTHHYHDFRLDTYTSTYEEGIVALAALVHKFFNVDGSERENVEYKKGKFEIELDRIVAEMAKEDSEEVDEK